VARLTEAHQAARARSSALSHILLVPASRSLRPDQTVSAHKSWGGRAGNQRDGRHHAATLRAQTAACWRPKRGAPRRVSVGLVFRAQRCFSAALRGAELSRCARCPPTCAAPGTLLSLQAQARAVARPMEAHQAACSSRRTLSRPARPPRSSLDLAHLVEAERGRRTLQAWQRGRRTLQAWQPWRTVSWCRGDKERAGSACRSGLRTPATCVSVF
jgi:hypothetical protein